jgi:hypothetical protein
MIENVPISLPVAESQRKLALAFGWQIEAGVAGACHSIDAERSGNCCSFDKGGRSCFRVRGFDNVICCGLLMLPGYCGREGKSC